MTQQLKVTNAEFGARQAAITFAGWGNTSYDLSIRLNRPHVSVRGAEMSGGKLYLRFPDGNGYQSKIATFHW